MAEERLQEREVILEVDTLEEAERLVNDYVNIAENLRKQDLGPDQINQVLGKVRIRCNILGCKIHIDIEW